MRILACILIAAIIPSAAQAQSADELAALNRQVVQLHRQGKYAAASALAEQVLAASERMLGTEHPDTLRSALASYERVLGPEHPDTLISVNNLGLLYDALGRYGEAELLHRRALAARERVLGTEHPDTLISVNNLAVLYREQGRYGEAEPLFKRALAARERVLGPEHPDTLSSVNNLGFLYYAQGPLWRGRAALSARLGSL